VAWEDRVDLPIKRRKLRIELSGRVPERFNALGITVVRVCLDRPVYLRDKSSQLVQFVAISFSSPPAEMDTNETSPVKACNFRPFPAKRRCGCPRMHTGTSDSKVDRTPQNRRDDRLDFAEAVSRETLNPLLPSNRGFWTD